MHVTTSVFLRHAGWFKWMLGGLWFLLLAGAAAGWWRPRSDWFLLVFVSLLALVFMNLAVRQRRERMIREAPFPQFLKRKLRETYPHLSQKDAELVERGLRQFFLACSRSRMKFVAMPSRAVDAMWHEFILHTHAYRDWCHLMLGRFLHHTPAQVLGEQAHRNDGLRRAWFWTCKEEAIDPRAPTRLPLLFALDTKLQIENGFHYVPDCHDIERKQAAGATGFAYCATDFGDHSISGDAGHFGGSEASDGSGGDGGCGGSGCGGGGCGGSSD